MTAKNISNFNMVFIDGMLLIITAYQKFPIKTNKKSGLVDSQAALFS